MNRLATESSPYLRQHAENPVEWYPWGTEALERAAAEDKPIFVSIGYASCHWCHVMAHESFEDEEVAADLSRSFISVKVDREVRPDIDAIYMPAATAMTGSGGWPLSVFCTPDGRPFFAGTYFPPDERHGMPSFRTILAALSEAWNTRRADIEEQADALTEAIAGELSITDRIGAMEAGTPDAWGADSAATHLDNVVAELADRFDLTYGGFGGAPKFPRPTFVDLCLRHHRLQGDPRSLEMASRTLSGMAAGGMYDHLAGGFARYSTDVRWLVPHFEKMLTDQALLARSYLHAYLETNDPDHLQVCAETLDFVLGELAGPDGGLCSSFDADADGVEGSHATFTVEQVEKALTDAGRPDLIEATLSWYGVVPGGNWEGTTVLSRPLSAPLSRPEEIEVARTLLLVARRVRPAPARDTKVLLEWNAMTVVALAEAAWATGNERWCDAAIEIGEFLFATMRRPDGRWLRCHRSDTPAFCADYAWVVAACLSLSTLTGRAVWLERAREVADSLISLFFDEDAGGFFTTGNDDLGLVVRGKDWIDGALPSANAVAIDALFRLAALTGEVSYREIATRSFDAAGALFARHPSAVADLVGALAFRAGTSVEIVIPGVDENLLQVLRTKWLPDAVISWGEPIESPLWADRSEGKAYVCRGSVCSLPATDAVTLAAQLNAGGPANRATGED